MIRAAIVGFSHMHVNEVALYINGQPDMELVAVSDLFPWEIFPLETKEQKRKAYRYTPLWNLQNVLDHYADTTEKQTHPFYYEDYITMLEQCRPDIVFLLTENRMKEQAAEEIIKRGITLCIEKPVAQTLEEAKRIQALAAQYGVEVVINWPVLWRPYLHKMKAAIDSGIIGTPIKLQYINGHTGPLGKGAKHRGVADSAQEMTDEERQKIWWYQRSKGGGVFLDIACYGCLFAKWFLGDGEKRAFAYGANLNTPYADVEDNFAGIIEYADKMAVIEGTWTTPRAVIPSGPVVLGTDGVLVCTGGAENHPDVMAYDIYGKEIILPDTELAPQFQNMPWQYAHHVKTGEPVHPMLTLTVNVEVMAMREALVHSQAEQKSVVICS